MSRKTDIVIEDGSTNVQARRLTQQGAAGTASAATIGPTIPAGCGSTYS